MKILSLCLTMLMLFSTASAKSVKYNENKSMEVTIVTDTDLTPRVQGVIMVVCNDKTTKLWIVGAKISARGCGVDIGMSTDESGSAKFRVTPTEYGNIVIEVDARHLGYETIESKKVPVIKIPYPPALLINPLPATTSSEIFVISGISEPASTIKSSLANPEILDHYNYGSFKSIGTVGDGSFKFEIRFPNKAGKYIINVYSTRDGLTTTKTVSIDYTPLKKQYRKVVMKIGAPDMLVNNEKYKLESPLTKSSPPLPAELKGNTYIQTISLMNALNAAVFWDEKENAIVIFRRLKNNVGTDIRLTTGNRQAKREGVLEYFDPDKKLYPVIINGRSFCPLRYIIEALFGSIAYDNKTGNITITIED